MKTNSILILVLSVVLIVSTLIAAPFDSKQPSLLATYFSYTEEEIATLYRFDSSKEMQRQELIQWDEVAANLIKNETPANAARIYAYLYTAQRDAADLSYNVKKRFEGSLNSISRKVLAEWFPQWGSQQKALEQDEDAYSNLLADIVMNKIKARMIEDQRSTHPYDLKKGDQYWAGKQPYEGLTTGSWKTWLINSGSEFRLSPPPSDQSPFWLDQLKQVKEACEKATASQKEAILFWAGKSSGNNPNGDWIKITNESLWSQNVSFAKTVFIRSVLAMAIEDAFIAAFDSKYTYWVKRPDMLDPQLKTYLGTPNHPSFPSAHSVVSNTVATVLSYFFPGQQNKWDDLAREAGLSRIWCGIHFPVDNQAGTAQGKQIGNAEIKIIQSGKIPQ